jgi:hypothetical protein
LAREGRAGNMILQELSGPPCMKPSVIVWDLETVPDLAGFLSAPGAAVSGGSGRHDRGGVGSS